MPQRATTNATRRITQKQFWFVVLNPIVWPIIIIRFIWYTLTTVAGALLYSWKHILWYAITFVVWNYKNISEKEYTHFKRVLTWWDKLAKPPTKIESNGMVIVLIGVSVTLALAGSTALIIAIGASSVIWLPIMSNALADT